MLLLLFITIIFQFVYGIDGYIDATVFFVVLVFKPRNGCLRVFCNFSVFFFSLIHPMVIREWGVIGIVSFPLEV